MMILVAEFCDSKIFGHSFIKYFSDFGSNLSFKSRFHGMPPSEAVVLNSIWIKKIKELSKEKILQNNEEAVNQSKLLRKNLRKISNLLGGFKLSKFFNFFCISKKSKYLKEER